MIDKESAPHYGWGEGCDGWHLVRTPELSVIQERMPPGTSEVRHRHGRARQFFFVLSGRLDGSTPFRRPNAAGSVRGRSWAIQDGILGNPFTGVHMYKGVGKHAGVCTFPGGMW